MIRCVSSRIGIYQMAIEKKLFVYDAGIRDGTMDYYKQELHSGIRATIFGASGTKHTNQVPSENPSLQLSVWLTAASFYLSISNTISNTQKILSNCESLAAQVHSAQCRSDVDRLYHELQRPKSNRKTHSEFQCRHQSTRTKT